MYYALLTFSAVLLSTDFVTNKIFQKLCGVSLKTSLAFNSLLGLFTAILFFFANGMRFDITPFSLIMATLFVLVVTSYNILGFRLLKSGSMAHYSLFLMIGGMSVPYVFGILFLKEPCTVLRTLALLLILLGVVFSNSKSHKITKSQLLMYISVFFLNGFSSIISKMHQINTDFKTVDALDFVILGGIVKFIIAGFLMLILKDKSTSKIGIKPLCIITLSTAFSGAAFLLQLLSASFLPATVLYPFLTGGSIIFSAIAGVVFFKDKLSKNIIFSIVLCFVGTLMLL